MTDNKIAVNGIKPDEFHYTNDISDIIDSVISPAFLNSGAGCASLPQSDSRQAFYTECFVGNPAFFPGGNIGNLAVNRTVNNILCSGATPRYMSFGLIIEDGFATSDLRHIAASISEAGRIAEVEIATRDFKILKCGNTGGIHITTSCIGELAPDIDLAPENICCGDKILISGEICRHAAAIASLNERNAMHYSINSDSASLGDIVHNLLDVCGNNIRVLSLLSQGGLAGAIDRLKSASGADIVIDRKNIPIDSDVLSVCRRFGIDPLNGSGEGVIIAVVPELLADTALAAVRRSAQGSAAAIIGSVVTDSKNNTRHAVTQ